MYRYLLLYSYIGTYVNIGGMYGIDMYMYEWLGIYWYR